MPIVDELLSTFKQARKLARDAADTVIAGASGLELLEHLARQFTRKLPICFDILFYCSAAALRS